MPSGIVTKLFGAATASGAGMATSAPATNPSASVTTRATRPSRGRARVTVVSLSPMAAGPTRAETVGPSTERQSLTGILPPARQTESGPVGLRGPPPDLDRARLRRGHRIAQQLAGLGDLVARRRWPFVAQVCGRGVL